VAQETEKANCSGIALRRCRVTEVLPAPEGAAMMMSLLVDSSMNKKVGKSKD